jgi:NAD(P)-dependent dehydrogenase (short-subunit alcohol dehydrogenase family)
VRELFESGCRNFIDAYLSFGGRLKQSRIPLHRFGEQIEIADLVLYLPSPASDFICSQVVVIDGGYSAV